MLGNVKISGMTPLYSVTRSIKHRHQASGISRNLHYSSLDLEYTLALARVCPSFDNTEYNTVDVTCSFIQAYHENWRCRVITKSSIIEIYMHHQRNCHRFWIASHRFWIANTPNVVPRNCGSSKWSANFWYMNPLRSSWWKKLGFVSVIVIPINEIVSLCENCCIDSSNGRYNDSW